MIPNVQPHLASRPSRGRLSVRLIAAAAGALLAISAVAPAFAQTTPTMLTLRAMPAKLKKGETPATLPPLMQADITDIRIGGKKADITAFDPLLKGPHKLQLMVLFDSMEMLGAGGQFEDIESFIHGLPTNVEVGVGWLLQGQVRIVQPFTMDREAVYKTFVAQTREQAANHQNDNGNPYMCLRWLAIHWPDPDPAKLRAVLMFTDGIIRNNNQSQAGDLFNPDVEGASQALQRAGIVPYPFFWLDPIVPDPNRAEGGSLEGQQYFTQLVKNTGGVALYEGMFAPGSLGPLLDKLYGTLASEAVVTVNAPGKPGKFTRLDIKTEREDIRIVGPDSVTIGNTIETKK